MSAIGDFGKVYKLSSLDPENPHVYIGSTSCYYATVRLCQHAEAHRNGWKDYKGIFDDECKCNFEILETFPKDENNEYKTLMKKSERDYFEYYGKDCVNIRKPCYRTPEEKELARKATLRKYHLSPKGQEAIKRAKQNQKAKQDLQFKKDSLTLKIKEYDMLLEPLLHELNNMSNANRPEAQKKINQLKEPRNKLVIELWGLSSDMAPLPGCDK